MYEDSSINTPTNNYCKKIMKVRFVQDKRNKMRTKVQNKRAKTQSNNLVINHITFTQACKYYKILQ